MGTSMPAMSAKKRGIAMFPKEIKEDAMKGVSPTNIHTCTLDHVCVLFSSMDPCFDFTI
jgi:hypothetical protein